MPFTPAVPTETNNVDNTYNNLFTVPVGRIFTEWTDNRVNPMTISAESGGDTMRASPLTASQPSDEMHISNEDIELVMSQADVSRSRAFTALKDNGNDDHVKITK